MFTDNIIRSTMFQVSLSDKAHRAYALLNSDLREYQQR